MANVYAKDLLKDTDVTGGERIVSSDTDDKTRNITASDLRAYILGINSKSSTADREFVDKLNIATTIKELQNNLDDLTLKDLWDDLAL